MSKAHNVGNDNGRSCIHILENNVKIFVSNMEGVFEYVGSDKTAP